MRTRDSGVILSLTPAFGDVASSDEAEIQDLGISAVLTTWLL